MYWPYGQGIKSKLVQVTLCYVTVFCMRLGTRLCIIAAPTSLPLPPSIIPTCIYHLAVRHTAWARHNPPGKTWRYRKLSNNYYNSAPYTDPTFYCLVCVGRDDMIDACISHDSTLTSTRFLLHSPSVWSDNIGIRDCNCSSFQGCLMVS